MLSRYRVGGLDKILQLYRFNENFVIDAYNQLGWFYYKTGRYRASINCFLFSSVSIFSTVIDFLKNKDPNFSFDNLNSLLYKALKYDTLVDYLERYNIFGCLYNLAAASYAFDYIIPANNLWHILSNFNEAGKYKTLSRRQLIKPWKEPYLENNRR